MHVYTHVYNNVCTYVRTYTCVGTRCERVLINGIMGNVLV